MGGDRAAEPVPAASQDPPKSTVVEPPASDKDDDSLGDIFSDGVPAEADMDESDSEIHRGLFAPDSDDDAVGEPEVAVPHDESNDPPERGRPGSQAPEVVALPAGADAHEVRG